MSLKEFFKSLSVYGILPVLTKFASFLLVPIYVRVFSLEEFGIVELLISSANFLIYAMNMEFYGAVGRFFFERDDLYGKRRLVSSGLLLTISASLIVVLIASLFLNQIGDILFRTQRYRAEIQVGLLWAVFAAISTYLSVLPRYLKKAKQYVLFNVISLLVKLLSTVLYVVFLKLGVMGAVLGNLTGAITSTILYASVTIIYVRPTFNVKDILAIVRFSLPLVPGVLIIGFYQPSMRAILSRVYSMEELGLFSFALKMVTIMAIVESSIKLSWKPMLYENIRKDNFGKEYYKISKFAGKILLGSGITLSIITPELIRIMGTSAYSDSAKLVGFLLIGNVLKNLIVLRGFGYELNNKTYLLSVVSISTSMIGVLFLYFISPLIGFLGIGLAFALPSIIMYFCGYNYTRRVIKDSFSYRDELYLWGLFVFTSSLLALDVSLFLRMLASIPLLVIVKPWKFRKILLQVMGKERKNASNQIGG